MKEYKRPSEVGVNSGAEGKEELRKKRDELHEIFLGLRRKELGLRRQREEYLVAQAGKSWKKSEPEGGRLLTSRGREAEKEAGEAFKRLIEFEVANGLPRTSPAERAVDLDSSIYMHQETFEPSDSEGSPEVETEYYKEKRATVAELRSLATEVERLGGGKISEWYLEQLAVISMGSWEDSRSSLRMMLDCYNCTLFKVINFVVSRIERYGNYKSMRRALEKSAR